MCLGMAAPVPRPRRELTCPCQRTPGICRGLEKSDDQCARLSRPLPGSQPEHETVIVELVARQGRAAVSSDKELAVARGRVQ